MSTVITILFVIAVCSFVLQRWYYSIEICSHEEFDDNTSKIIFWQSIEDVIEYNIKNGIEDPELLRRLQITKSWIRFNKIYIKSALGFIIVILLMSIIKAMVGLTL